MSGPSFVWTRAAALLVGSGLLLVAGCGGCGKSGRSDPYAAWGGLSKEEWLKQYEQRKQKERQEKAEAKAAQAAAERKARQEAEARRKQRQAEPAQTARALKPAGDRTAELPADATLWSDAEFLRARDLGEPRLIQAIAWRGRTRIGKPGEVEFLLRLLGVGEAKESAATAQRGITRQDRRALLAPVAEALAANGTAESRAALLALLAGHQLQADEGRPAAEAVLRALAAHPQSEHRALLAGILMEPGSYCPPGRPGVTPEELQRMALEAVRRLADRPLRTTLAEHWAARPTEGSRRLLGPLLLEPHPANLEAQAVLYAVDLVPVERMGRLEQQLAAAGAQALDHVLGRQAAWPANVSESLGRASALEDTELLEAIAGRLWSAGWARGLEVRLASVNTLAERASLVTLASVVPRQAIRDRLVRVLSRHWPEGPEPLRKAGLGAAVVPEMGFLAVLCQATAASSQTMSKSSPLPRRTAVTGRLGVGEANPDPLGADSAWSAFEQEVFRLQAARLQDAARVAALRRTATDANAEAAAAALCPVYPGAEAASSLYLRLPQASPGPKGPSGVPALADRWPEAEEIGYLRLEVRASLEKVSAYYRRQLGPKTQLRRLAPDGKSGARQVVPGFWLSRVAPGEAADSWQWVGVLAYGTPSGPSRAEVVQELTIEIIALGHGAPLAQAPQKEADEENEP